VFALLGAGMDASRGALTETHAAMFADSVFNGMRARSLRAASTNDWEVFWSRFIARQTNIPVAAWAGAGGGAWSNASQLAVSNGGIYTVIFRNRPYHDAATPGVENHALRYRCTASLLYPATVLWTNKAMVTLQVWDGEFGSTSNDTALTFYSEFYNQGDL